MLVTLQNLLLTLNAEINIWIVVKIFIWLFAILNPFSTIPYYLIFHPNAKNDEVKSDSKKISFAVFSILMISALAGTYILKMFGLEIVYFKIAGWVIVSYMAFSMVKWDVSKIKADTSISKTNENSDYLTRWLVIPLAMPLTSWPGTIAYVIWIAHWNLKELIALLIAICIASFCTYIILKSGARIKWFLWDLGLRIITRFMWLILLWLWLQIMITNLLTVIHW